MNIAVLSSDDNEAYVRAHCPTVEVLMKGEWKAKNHVLIILRPELGEASPAIWSNDIAHAWREAAAAVRRELENET